MKKFYCLSALLLLSQIASFSQTTFNKTEYFDFIKNNDGLTFNESSTLFPLPQEYFMAEANAINPYGFNYFDSLEIKYKLTKDEIDLVKKNGFVVSERLSYGTFLGALDDIYGKDMPVMVTTDAILYSLHASYDNILKELEAKYMEPNLIDALSKLYNSYSNIYESDSTMRSSFEDVDLYVTVALSLIKGSEQQSNIVEQKKVTEILGFIKGEKVAEIALFADKKRYIDFSQFKPRGHYLGLVDKPNKSPESLEKYFRTMMWLGRIDFTLTSPDFTYTTKDLKRMNISAMLLNKLLDISESRTIFEQNDRIINFMVGQSDNLTPSLFKTALTELNITDAKSLNNDIVYKKLIEKLSTTEKFGQRIMSDIIMTNPFDSVPHPLSVSFKLMGQRFIVDSYVLSNVVFSRIVNKGKLELRLMPSPLDALFALGNNNALPLLENELNTYHYSLQLSSMRKLIDGYDEDYWGETLYNTWLQSLRQLNAPADTAKVPFFITTAAWQHEKMNTQLASWAQLRHDNILYAKPSYTDGTLCSYPYSYVEPYPEFYKHIAIFAEKGKALFKEIFVPNTGIYGYFERLNEVMTQLETISRKELDNKPLTDDEILFLKQMLSRNTIQSCGSKPLYGWYTDLFYGEGEETVIADIHTQATDSFNTMVGRVLHAATGKVNLGIFLAKAPMPDGRPMAFIGPVQSYYELITEDFKRYTDIEWQNMVTQAKVPARPDWVNIYLANKKGEKLSQGRELPYEMKGNINSISDKASVSFAVNIYPNPVSDNAFLILESVKAGEISIDIFDQCGRMITNSLYNNKTAGRVSVSLETSQLKSGLYFCKIKSGAEQAVVKLIKR